MLEEDLAGGSDEEGHGDEWEEATQASKPKCKRARINPVPTATCRVTSGSTLAEHTDEGEEEGPPPHPKKSSVSDSLSPDQEQKPVDFFASNPLFYDQTLHDFKNKSKKDHLLGTIGSEVGLSCKC